MKKTNFMRAFRVKTFLSTTAIIAVLISAGCGLLRFSSKTEKIPPDELFYVAKYEAPTYDATHAFMDKTGKIVLGPWKSFEWNGKKYGEDAETKVKFLPFSEGMAGVCFYETRLMSDSEADCGFIDKTGKLAIEPKFERISYFSEGLAAVSGPDLAHNGRFGYIDKTGKLVIEIKYVSKAAFHDGLVPFLDLPNEKGKERTTGYLDKTGKVVIEQKMDMMGNFNDGYAIVKKFGGESQIIDKTGKTVKSLENESVGNTDYFYKKTYEDGLFEGYSVEDNLMTSFNEGLAMNFDRSKIKSIGFVNTAGELEIKLDPELVGEIRPFSEGFAPVGWRRMIYGRELPGETYNWTFVNRKGEVMVKLDDTFFDARPFSEGLAAVRTMPNKAEGRWAFINTQFQEVVPACFELVDDFRGGLAKVLLVANAGEKKGCERYYSGGEGGKLRIYIDKNGNAVSPQW